LFDRIANEPHAAELSGDKETRNIGLKIRADMGQFDAAGFRSKDKLDRAYRAGRAAGAVTHALAPRDQFRFPLYETDNIAFGTSCYAGTAANTY
jgi:hypothetical protein